MARPRPRRRPASPAGVPQTPPQPTVIERVMDLEDSSLLDVLDHVLNKGVMATGDLTLGVAGIDLIYIRLSALLCAADRVMPSTTESKTRATVRRRRRTARRTS